MADTSPHAPAPRKVYGVWQDFNGDMLDDAARMGAWLPSTLDGLMRRLVDETAAALPDWRTLNLTIARHASRELAAAFDEPYMARVLLDVELNAPAPHLPDTRPEPSPPARATDDVVRGVLALADVADERRRQDKKWGEQNHPDGTGRAGWAFRELVHGILRDGLGVRVERVRDGMRDTTNHEASLGRCTWAHILLEEVFEALAEDDPIKVRDELVQVAAVATQWVEAIDRRGVPRRGATS